MCNLKTKVKRNREKLNLKWNDTETEDLRKEGCRVEEAKGQVEKEN